MDGIKITATENERSMKLIILLFLTTVFFACNGHKKTEIVDENGYREVFYLDKENVRQGIYLKTNPDDIVIDSCFYLDGQMHGVRKIWTGKGELDILETYEKGILNGPYFTYYANGQVKKSQKFVNNSIEGEVMQYFPDGQLKAVVQFSGNLENGPFREYFENGKIAYEGFYKGGDFEQDTLKEYNMKGELVRKLFCENGVCQTVWTPEKGNIERKKIFEDGIPQSE